MCPIFWVELSNREEEHISWPKYFLDLSWTFFMSFHFKEVSWHTLDTVCTFSASCLHPKWLHLSLATTQWAGCYKDRNVGRENLVVWQFGNNRGGAWPTPIKLAGDTAASESHKSVHFNPSKHSNYTNLGNATSVKNTIFYKVFWRGNYNAGGEQGATKGGPLSCFCASFTLKYGSEWYFWLTHTLMECSRALKLPWNSCFKTITAHYSPLELCKICSKIFEHGFDPPSPLLNNVEKNRQIVGVGFPKGQILKRLRTSNPNCCAENPQTWTN